MTTANILVVEDEKIIAKGIEKRLKGLGYAVAALASSGAEAIQPARRGAQLQIAAELILVGLRFVSADHLALGRTGRRAGGLVAQHQSPGTVGWGLDVEAVAVGQHWRCRSHANARDRRSGGRRRGRRGRIAALGCPTHGL